MVGICESQGAFLQGAIAGGTDRYRFGWNLISVTIDGTGWSDHAPVFLF